VSEPSASIVPANGGQRQPVKRWFPEGFYSMQADKGLMEIATSTSLPTAMRLYFACAARANRWGHAPFMPGEMRRVLRVSANTQKSAIQSLVSAKLAAPQSTAMCVALDAEAYRRGDRANRTCIEPGHVEQQKLMWVHSLGWEEYPGCWHERVLDRDAGIQWFKEVTRTKTITETETVRMAAVDGRSAA
jgi:hypothetical protein